MVGDADCGRRPDRLNPLVLFCVLTIRWIGHDGFWLLDLGSAGILPAVPRTSRPRVRRRGRRRNSRRDDGATDSSLAAYKTVPVRLALQRPARESRPSTQCPPPPIPAARTPALCSS